MSIMSDSLTGLIAATFTPLHKDRSVDLPRIQPLVAHLVGQGIAGLYVLGSTGEGGSLTYDERCEVAAAFVQAANSQIPVIVQVGHESLRQAQMLAAHAQEIGADAVSAVSPVYFKPESTETLVDSMAQIAAGAPQLPFFYYHIPEVTGIRANMADFLRLAGDRIPTFAGIKFTSTRIDEYQSCLELAEGRYQIFYGVDEMLLSSLTAGARAAVGSTYNFAAPIYRKLLTAYSSGDLPEARRLQAQSQAIVRAFVPYGPRAAQKAIMGMIGMDCGPCRLPLTTLTPSATASLRRALEDIGFFQWIA